MIVELPGVFVIRVSLSEINDRRVDCIRRHHVLISDCFASGGIRGYFFQHRHILVLFRADLAPTTPLFLLRGYCNDRRKSPPSNGSQWDCFKSAKCRHEPLVVRIDED